MTHTIMSTPPLFGKEVGRIDWSTSVIGPVGKNSAPSSRGRPDYGIICDYGMRLHDYDNAPPSVFCLCFVEKRWGVLHFEQEEQTRSQFRGKEQVDPITGGFVREYPFWKRWATYAMTMPVMVGFTGGVLTLMFLVSMVLFMVLLSLRLFVLELVIV